MQLRKRGGRERILGRDVHLADSEETAPKVYLAEEVRDDLLQMLFVCCDPTIPVDSQLVLALKTLCGFKVREISQDLWVMDTQKARTQLAFRSQIALEEGFAETARSYHELGWLPVPSSRV